MMVWPVMRELRQDAKDRALIAAVDREDASAVIRLLNAGADVNAKDVPEDKWPFWRACWDLLRNQKTEVAGAMSALQIAVEDVHPASGIVRAYEHSEKAARMMQILLEHGADPNAAVERGSSPLLFTLDHGDTVAALLLIQHGAKMIIMDDGKPVPLLINAVSDDAVPRSFIQAMLDKGADIDVRDGKGRTALMIAAELENLSMVKFLLAHHCRVNGKDDMGNTVLWYASNHNNRDPNMHLLNRAGAR